MNNICAPRFFKKIFVTNLSFLLIILVLISFSDAATYYVAPSGAGTWLGCTNINSPCSVSTAMTNAVAGDTVYFLDGKYIFKDYARDFHLPLLNPTNSGTSTNPIVFKSLNHLRANIHGIGVNESAYTAILIGSYLKNYIVWDGFLLTARNPGDTRNIYAMARFGDGTGCTIKNSEFVGGIHSSGGTTNNAGIAFERMSYLLIENNKVHDYLESSNNENNNGINGYSSNNVTIKNNDIYNNTIGIHFKDNIDDSKITDNFINNNYIGIYISNTNASGACERNIISNNVIAKNKFIGISAPNNGTQMPNDLVVSNNTIYGNSTVGIGIGVTAEGKQPKIYNNIIAGSKETFNTQGANKTIQEADHNQWSLTFSITMHQYQTNQITYTSLSKWQSSGELYGGLNPGTGDLASDPKFANVSGLMTQLADYKVSNASGRNGSMIGAEISTIGVKSITSPTGLKLVK